MAKRVLPKSQLDAFIELYGSQLEGLSRKDKLALRVVLTIYCLHRIKNEEYTIADAYYVPFSSEILSCYWNLLEGISVSDAEALIECITIHECENQ